MRPARPPAASRELGFALAVDDHHSEACVIKLALGGSFPVTILCSAFFRNFSQQPTPRDKRTPQPWFPASVPDISREHNTTSPRHAIYRQGMKQLHFVFWFCAFVTLSLKKATR